MQANDKKQVIKVKKTPRKEFNGELFGAFLIVIGVVFVCLLGTYVYFAWQTPQYESKITLIANNTSQNYLVDKAKRQLASQVLVNDDVLQAVKKDSLVQKALQHDATIKKLLKTKASWQGLLALFGKKLTINQAQNSNVTRTDVSGMITARPDPLVSKTQIIIKDHNFVLVESMAQALSDYYKKFVKDENRYHSDYQKLLQLAGQKQDLVSKQMLIKQKYLNELSQKQKQESIQKIDEKLLSVKKKYKLMQTLVLSSYKYVPSFLKDDVRLNELATDLVVARLKRQQYELSGQKASVEEISQKIDDLTKEFDSVLGEYILKTKNVFYLFKELKLVLMDKSEKVPAITHSQFNDLIKAENKTVDLYAQNINETVHKKLNIMPFTAVSGPSRLTAVPVTKMTYGIVLFISLVMGMLLARLWYGHARQLNSEKQVSDIGNYPVLGVISQQ